MPSGAVPSSPEKRIGGSKARLPDDIRPRESKKGGEEDPPSEKLKPKKKKEHPSSCLGNSASEGRVAYSMRWWEEDEFPPRRNPSEEVFKGKSATSFSGPLIEEGGEGDFSMSGHGKGKELSTQPGGVL